MKPVTIAKHTTNRYRHPALSLVGVISCPTGAPAEKNADTASDSPCPQSAPACVFVSQKRKDNPTIQDNNTATNTPTELKRSSK